MEPPRALPLSMSLPARASRHYAYSFDSPLHHRRPITGAGPSGGGYVSPNPSPSAPDFYTQSHDDPYRQDAALTTPRGYPAQMQQGSSLFTTSELGRQATAGYRSPDEFTYDYRYASMPRYGKAVGHGEMDPFFVPALPAKKEEKKGRKTRKTPDVKQETFLTKLYRSFDNGHVTRLMFREQQEYRHIIRWDDDGEVIIIERPVELAEKVLPLVYRQSRFASFSRQLNIYGFMRKVSLRHVEEGIIDPDASTWSHGTLRRDSAVTDIVNFKRRVGPRPSQAKRRMSAPEHPLSPAESDNSDTGEGYFRQSHGEQVHGPPGSPLFENGTVLFQQTPDQGYADISGVSPDSDDYPLLPDPHSYQSDQQHQQQLQQQEQVQHHQLPAQYSAYGMTQSVHVPDFSPVYSGIPYTAFLPQSAPIYNRSYTDMQVMQGHLRTRSMQGEPPSATLWTPAPYGSTANSWTAPMSADLGLGMGYQSLPTTREGWVNCYSGEPMSPPPNSLGMIGARMANYEQESVPTPSTTPLGPGLSLGEPFQLRPAMHSRHDSFTDTPSPAELPPATVSPGVYQSGFTPPVNILTRTVSSPRPAASTVTLPSTTRAERRQSISSTPYSASARQARQPPSLGLAQLSMSPGRGPFRGLGGMSDGYKSSTMGTPEMLIPELPRVGIVGEAEDEGLPSAGMMVGLEESPFQMILRKEDLTDGEDA